MYRLLKYINLHENPVSIVTYNIQKFPWLFKSFKNIRIMLNKFNIVLLQECFDETFESLHTLFPAFASKGQIIISIEVH